MNKRNEDERKHLTVSIDKGKRSFSTGQLNLFDRFLK